MKLAGKRSVMLERAMVTEPSSSGWRSISSTSRGNSGNSSRNSTPLCARLTSPGRGMPEPPPISPASEMVWCGARNGRCVQQSGAARQQARDAVDLGGLDGFVEGERRQDAGEPFRQHGLAGAGRADHQYVMGAGGRDFQRALGHGLAANVAEIGQRLRVGAIGRCVTRLTGVNSSGRVEQRDHLGQVAHAINVDAFHHRRLGRVLRRHDQIGNALLRAQTATESAPRTGRMAPSSDSSPIERCAGPDR